MNQEEVLREMIQVGRRLDSLGYVPATDGNISVRLDSGDIVATVSGVRKGSLAPKHFCTLDIQGNQLRGQDKASTEIQMHLAVYKARADVKAVVHAHPPTATGFAVAGIPLHQCVLPEVVATIGAVPLASYGTPSTAELPQTLLPYLEHHDAILLANHGVVTFGSSLFHAANRMETVEQFARILFVARTLGRVNLLTRDQVERLNEIRGRYGLAGRAADCLACREERPFTDVDLILAGMGRDTCATGLDSPPESSAPAPVREETDILVDRVTSEVLRILRKG